MKISEIITDKYKLRIPPTVYYDLLADVVEIEEQEPCEDCVSRKQVLTEIKKWWRTALDAKGTPLICETIKELPPVQPKQEWIPVTERLPELKHQKWGYRESDPVYVTVRQKELIGAPLVPYTYCVNDDNIGIGRWYADLESISECVDLEEGSSGHNMSLDSAGCEVIAWMPKFELYKENKDESNS